MRQSARRAYLLIPVLLTALPGCRRQTDRQSEADLPLPVMAEPVKIGDIRGTVSATGVVNTLEGADFVITSPAPARIAELSKQVGDQVKAGEVLVRFEFLSLRAENAARSVASKAAAARLQAARLVQSRVHDLFDKGAAARTEVDQADQEVAEAEAEVEQARSGEGDAQALAQRSIVRAPFDGVVAERLHNPGDTVGNTSNEIVLRIIDPRQVEVSATVPVQDLQRFTVGATARASAGGKGSPELMRVAARPEPERGATTATVTLSFVQPTDLASGTQVGIEIDAEQHSNVLLVPSIAVVKEGDTASVFVAAGNQARKRTVTTGLVDEQRTEVRSGVKAGEIVITQGQSNLKDGAAISVTQ